MMLTSGSLYYRLSKVARYFRIYGISRTLAKVKGQYHMKRRFSTLPALPARIPEGGEVGIIGCGNFAFTTIAFYLRKNFGPVLRSAMDLDLNKAASLYQHYALALYSDRPEDIIDDPLVRLVYVASNHATHAEYAIAALHAGKSVHIEKPFVVNEDQLERLCGAMHTCPGKVALGFNRPQSKLFSTLKQALDSQQGPYMFSFFIAGHELSPDHWYHHKGEGGRVLGNLCHWTDIIYQMLPPESRFPVEINPTRAEKADCDIAVTFKFGDGSIAAVTFSAKGQVFDGVRERLTIHRGNVLASISDFDELVIQNQGKTKAIKPLFRDQGHEENICRSFRMLTAPPHTFSGCSVQYVRETGMLFLKTREALETNQKITLASL